MSADFPEPFGPATRVSVGGFLRDGDMVSPIFAQCLRKRERTGSVFDKPAILPSCDDTPSVYRIAGRVLSCVPCGPQDCVERKVCDLLFHTQQPRPMCRLSQHRFPPCLMLLGHRPEDGGLSRAVDSSQSAMVSRGVAQAKI